MLRLEVGGRQPHLVLPRKRLTSQKEKALWDLLAQSADRVNHGIQLWPVTCKGTVSATGGA